MILLLLLTINVIFNASLGISKVFPLLQASSILVIIITTMILLLTINIIVKGWCWKSLLGGGALYGPADWNGSLSGQEVRLSQDYNFIFIIFSIIIFMATNILVVAGVIVNQYGYLAMDFYLAKRRDYHKDNRCLATYSPRATTTDQPTNRAPNEPARPGPK